MKVIAGGLSDANTSRPAKAHPAESFADRGETLVGKIATELAREIIDGSLPAGGDLNSVELAARFGTSRTPVREALMLLEKEGLVEIEPRRRPRVARISWREIEEIYEVRAHMNVLMMRLFVVNASQGALRESRAAYDRMRVVASRRDVNAFVEERGGLHDFWAAQCGNGALHKALDAWRTRLSLRRMVTLQPEDIERSLLDHQRLVLACEERDAELAATLIHSMTLSGLEAIRQSGWGGTSGG
ncbi:MAG: GntR family transcriptional regulator [Sphingomonadales bacterium]